MNMPTTRMEELMNRTQLIDAVAAATGLPRTQVDAFLSATLTQVQGVVASGDKVQLLGFGTFERRERGARTARNPSTGAPLELAATRAVGFKVGATFKQQVADSLTAKPRKKATDAKTPAKPPHPIPRPKPPHPRPRQRKRQRKSSRTKVPRLPGPTDLSRGSEQPATSRTWTPSRITGQDQRNRWASFKEIDLFQLPLRNVTVVPAPAAVVEPDDPFQGGDLDLPSGPPRAAGFDQLGLVQTVDRLGQGIVAAVAGVLTEAPAPPVLDSCSTNVMDVN